MFKLQGGNLFPWLGLAVLPILLVLPWLFLGDPWDPDETRYLEIFREMQESGDWLVPRFNSIAYLEKPPLYYWLGAASFQLFGASVIAGRLVSVAAALGTILATAWIGNLAGGRRLAWRAGLLLSLSPFFIILAPIVTLDMTLSFWVTAAIAALLHGLWESEEPRRGRGPAILLAFVFLALGFLTKGPVALALPGFVWLSWWSGKSWRAFVPPRWSWKFLALGGLVFLAMVLPWFILVTKIYGEKFLEFFFYRGNLARLLGEKVRRVNFHRQPFYIYLPILLGGAFPWSLYLLAPWRALRRELLPAAAERLFWGWLVPGLLFFSIVPAKLPTYVLPLFPPLALLAARHWERYASGELPRAWKAGLSAATLLTASVASAIFLSLVMFSHANLLASRDGRLVAGYCAAAMLLAGLSFLAARRENSRQAFLYLVFFMVLSPPFGAVAMTPINRQRSLDALARLLPEVATPDDLLICLDRYIPILSFRLDRPALIAGARGELEYGSRDLGERPELFIEEARVEELIRGEMRIFLSVRASKWETLKASYEKDLHLLGRCGEMLLFSNRQAPWPEKLPATFLNPR